MGRRQDARCGLVVAVLLAGPLGAQPARHPDCNYPRVASERWFSFRMGDFLLEGMPPAAVRKLGSEERNGYSYERIELRAPSARFRVEGSALQGELTDIYVCGLYLKVAGEERPRLRIPPGGLIMTLRSQLPPLPEFYGGQVVLPRQKTWISNRTEVAIDPHSKAGRLSFEMHPVRLQAVSIEFPLLGASTISGVSRPEIRPGAPTGGPEFAFDLADNSLKLVEGAFDLDLAPALKAAQGGFQAETARLDVTAASAKSGVLTLHQGTTTVAVHKIALTMRALIKLADDPLEADGRLSFEALEGSQGADPAVFQLREGMLRGGAFQETARTATCDTLKGITDEQLTSLGLERVVARRAAAAALTQELAESHPQVYATLPLAPLQRAVENGLEIAATFANCPSRIVASGRVEAIAPEGRAAFGVRVGHEISFRETLAVTRNLEGATLEGASLATPVSAARLTDWLTGRGQDALLTLGTLAPLTLPAPFAVRPTVSTAAWVGGLSGSAAHPRSEALGSYRVYLDDKAAHVLGGLR